MTQTVKGAIEESILRDKIVDIEEPTAQDLADLKAECDDSVENGPVFEFWGRDEEGDDWRVHAEISNWRIPTGGQRENEDD